jgi:hypothetical protein
LSWRAMCGDGTGGMCLRQRAFESAALHNSAEFCSFYCLHAYLAAPSTIPKAERSIRSQAHCSEHYNHLQAFSCPASFAQVAQMRLHILLLGLQAIRAQALVFPHPGCVHPGGTFLTGLLVLLERMGRGPGAVAVFAPERPEALLALEFTDENPLADEIMRRCRPRKPFRARQFGVCWLLRSCRCGVRIAEVLFVNGSGGKTHRAGAADGRHRA